MPKAVPLIRSMNAGVFSPLMEGRTDIDKYPSSLSFSKNVLAVAQGPAIRRSGTEFISTVRDEAQKSFMVPFLFNDEQAQQIEFSNGKIRFIQDTGIVVHPLVTVTAVGGGSPLALTAAGHGASIGDFVGLTGFAVQTLLNGRIVEVTGVSGDDITLDLDRPAGTIDLTTAKVARVFELDSPYLGANVESIRYVGDVDTIRLFCRGYRPYILTRKGVYDWTMEVDKYIDGPFLPINETGTRITPDVTGDIGLAAGTTTGSSGTNPNSAFDLDPTTYWIGENQTGTLQKLLTTPAVVTGYAIHVPVINTNATFASVDRAPSSWTFEGFDGSVWHVLDRKTGYVLYENLRSVFFSIQNAVAYAGYRIVISECRRNGAVNPAISRFVLAGPSAGAITLTASAVTGINKDQGFLATDVGRLIRLKGGDSYWRSLEITARTSATVVVASLQGEPLIDLNSVGEWRIGYFSDTTGWPRFGYFSDDRLYVGGAAEYPNVVAGSFVGIHNSFSQTDADGTVNDDNAVVLSLRSSELASVQWISEDDRGVLLGSTAGPFPVKAASDSGTITARDAKTKASNSRGAADIAPVKVDNQILFVQKARRTLRELAYVFEVDGYKTPSMSLFASHLGVPRIKQIVYAAEPHSIVWVLLDNGKLLGFTYNRDQDNIGWHPHEVDGLIECISVTPSDDGENDILWAVISRTIDGQQRRYIERFQPSWDFGDTLDTAWFADCALRYEGPSTDIVYAWHLEGRECSGLIDGSPVSGVTFVDGAAQLPVAGTNIILGIGYDSEGVLSRIEAGAADGTAQSKIKRINRASLLLWDSAGGYIGKSLDELEPILGRAPNDPVTDPQELKSQWIGPIALAPGYGPDGYIAFKQPAELALPFNVVAIAPHVTTQDG